MEHERTHPTATGIVQQLSPKAAFLLGLTTATAVLAIAALAILLPITLRGSGTARGETTPSVAGAEANAPAGATAPTVGDFRDVDTKRDHIRGSKTAKVSVIEYSDLECPFCKRHHPVMQQLLQEYDGKINWVYRHFPLDSLHPKARKEAEATECANELGGSGAFWKYVDLVYAETPSNNGLDPAQLPAFAERIGLNQQKFQTCLDSGKYAKTVADDLQDATTAGAEGTPHSLIVGAKGDATPLSGALPIEQFRAAIDQALGA